MASNSNLQSEVKKLRIENLRLSDSVGLMKLELGNLIKQKEISNQKVRILQQENKILRQRLLKIENTDNKRHKRYSMMENPGLLNVPIKGFDFDKKDTSSMRFLCDNSARELENVLPQKQMKKKNSRPSLWMLANSRMSSEEISAEGHSESSVQSHKKVAALATLRQRVQNNNENILKMTSPKNTVDRKSQFNKSEKT